MRKREKRERKKHDRGIVDFAMVTNHFFHSLLTEFIENEKADVSKQDCELNVAKRLLGKIKKLIRDFQSVYREMHYMR